METIVFIITVIGGIAGIYTILDYRKNHVEKPNEEREHMIVQFNATQTLSKNVRNQLIEYAEKYNAYDEIIFPSATVKVYIQMLEQSQQTNLSDKLFEDTLKLPLTSSIIQSMTKSLEEQNRALLQVEGWVKIRNASMLGSV